MRHRVRRAVGALLAAAACAATAAVAHGATPPTQTAVYQAARSGQTAEQILAGLYPSSVLGTTSNVPVRVLVADLAPRVVIVSSARLRLTDEGRPRAAAALLPAGHRYKLVRRRGRFVLDDLDAGTRRVLTGPVVLDARATAGLRLAEPLGRRYRGALRVEAGSGRTMRVVNAVDLERYLWGALPGQAPAVWGVEAPQALAAAAIATRTQVLSSTANPAAGYDLTADDPPYHGRDGERPAVTPAVTDTAGQVLTQNGAPFAAALILDGWRSPFPGAAIRLAETAPAKPVPGARPGLGPAAVAAAMSFRGTPYLWGGATPAGFDCSGLVQYVYRGLGITLPRVTTDQAQAGLPVQRDQLVPGDAVFFADATGYVHHVGIYIGGGDFVHAPHTGDVVKVSTLATGYYAAEYAGARRYSY